MIQRGFAYLLPQYSGRILKCNFHTIIIARMHPDWQACAGTNPPSPHPGQSNFMQGIYLGLDNDSDRLVFSIYPHVPVQIQTAILLLLTPLGEAATELTPAPDFRQDIQPILERKCVRCHQQDKKKGDLRIDTYEKIMEGGSDAEAIVPGKPEESELILRAQLRPIDEGFMPDEGQALDSDELELLIAWVRAGAHWPKGVTLTEKKPDPVKRVSLPTKPPANLLEAASMLDDILRRENLGHKAITTPVINDDAFLRRATIDLIGRIPTHREIELYQSWKGDRREKLVDHLLDHERFADRWTVFMADMLRIRSDVTGGNSLLAYVNASISQGKPYDEFVRALISASGKPNSNPAVGYILGDNAMPMELAAATSQVFLGVRIGCAMCHDHPFDDWDQKDFYELAAFFGKTKKVQNRGRGMVYTTEGTEMSVLWPPEDKAEPEDRKPVLPQFPFTLTEFDHTPTYLQRFEAKRKSRQQASSADESAASIDELLDAVEPTPGRKADPVLAEARQESKNLNVLNELYRASELRNQLADLVTNPRNGFFARSFVNRIWAELIGHGFVEPLDNFSDYNELRHASSLDFLAQEFTANAYDIRSLIKTITLSDAYRRSPLGADTAITQRNYSEIHFTAAPARRMLGEVLYDSVVVAGHLEDFKWPQGANLRKVEKQIRVATGEMAEGTPASKEAMAAKPVAMRNDGYDLESSLTLDFKSLLKKEAQGEIESMRMKSDEQLQAKKMAAAASEQNKKTMVFKTETVIETVDDNPRFSSAMRMATPAPPAHFLRVFGQPTRTGLGEFRDDSASLRQQLMMLNGRLTHEASRVGPKEPLHRLLQHDPDRAIDMAYQEILTRLPSADEKSEAREILSSSPKPEDGMADLRWALLNSHEFRFLP